MNRRRFLITSMGGAAAVFASVAVADRLLDQGLLRSSGTETLELPGLDQLGAVTPNATTKAAVNVVVPADPLIPGDFKGTDYGADQLLADTLGSAGQTALYFQLNAYAWKVAKKVLFTSCNEAQRLAAIKKWIEERDTISVTNRDLLSALLSVSIFGTYERKTAAQRDVLFQKMGWYDPANPTKTFHIPCYGYDTNIDDCERCHPSS